MVWRLTNGTLEQGRVRASDGAILYPFSTVGTGSVKPVGVTFDGRDYRVAWAHTVWRATVEVVDCPW